jgi:hypothetical protein
VLVRQFLRGFITLAASIASYYLVERPVLQSRRLLRSRVRVFTLAIAASTVTVAVTIAATALPGTIATQLVEGSDTACPGERNDRYLTCTFPIGTDSQQLPVGLALMGDSTGRALGPGLNEWARRTDHTWVDSAWKLCTVSGQMIIADGAQPDAPARMCHDSAPQLISETLRKYRPPVVLVSEYWASSRSLLVAGQEVKAGTPEHDAALKAGYLDLVDQVAAYGGRVVFLELPPPGNQLGTAVATSRPAGTSRPPVFGNGRYVDGFNTVLRSAAAARPLSASTVAIDDLVCPNGVCSPLQGDMLVRFDGVHYTTRFSRYLVPILIQRLGLVNG